MQRKSKTNRVVAKVVAASSQETLVLSQDSQNPYDELDSVPICDAIAQNTRLRRLRVESYVTRRSAQDVVDTFTAHPRLEELTLPISKVHDPSQLKILRWEENAEEVVAAHNAIKQREHQAAFNAFKATTSRITGKKRARTAAPELPEDIIEDFIGPLAAPRPKRLHLHRPQ